MRPTGSARVAYVLQRSLGEEEVRQVFAYGHAQIDNFPQTSRTTPGEYLRTYCST